MKVSIVIPVYNVEKYLEECLESAVNQTLNDIEIICVNDGSTDGSLDILRRYEKEYDNLIVINQENKGLSGARNSGIRVAKGEYIYFLDSDDYISLDAMEICYKESKENDLDIVHFNAEAFYDKDYKGNKFNEGLDRGDSIESKVMNGEDFYVYLNDKYAYRAPVWLNFYRYEFLVENNLYFYEGILHEDEIHTMTSFIEAKRIKYIKDKLFKRRIRFNSIMTSNINKKRILGNVIIAEEAYKVYNEKNIMDKTKQIIFGWIKRYYKNSMIYCDMLELYNEKISIYNNIEDAIRDIELDILINSPNLNYNKKNINKCIKVCKDIFLRENSTDIDVFNQIFTNKEYDIELPFDNNDILNIIDAGANIGLGSIFLKERYINANIVAVEPEKNNYDMLLLNTKKFEGSIKCVLGAIWKNDLFIEIVDNGYGEWVYMTKETQKKNSNSIEAFTISRIMSENKFEFVDILKIDIEGAEKEVFENCDMWIDKVKVIIIELHERMKPGCEKAVFGKLLNENYSYYTKGENIVFVNNNLI